MHAQCVQLIARFDVVSISEVILKQICFFKLYTHMFSEKVSMWSQHRVNVSNVLHDFLYSPQIWILTAGPGAFSKTAWTCNSRSPDLTSEKHKLLLNRSSNCDERFVKTLHLPLKSWSLLAVWKPNPPTCGAVLMQQLGRWSEARRQSWRVWGSRNLL